MFEQMLLPTGGTHQARDAMLAFVAQAVLVVGAAVVIPALFVAQLPQLQLAAELIAPPLPPPPPPPPPPAAALRAEAPVTTKIVPRTFVLPQVVAPKAVPQEAPMVADAPPVLAGVTGGVDGGIPGGIPGGVLGGSLDGLIGAPPPPAASQLRVGGDVQAARLTHEVKPNYPVIAREARISGVVQLSAAIAPNGTVENLKVLSGNPLLVDAAVNAVKQWTYRPTYLNGKPVEVLTEVDVKFSLG